MGIKVVVKNNNYEKALSIFKRKVKDSNLMYELREREHYKKPSMIRKEMKNKAKARNYWKKVKLSEEDSFNILKRYNLTNKSQLPVLLKDDVISKYYNYNTGDIIEITNTNTSQNGNYKFYRCVR